jgi:polar amino acid transport system substrate-binding protein
MKLSQTVGTVLISLVVSLAVVHFVSPTKGGGAVAQAKETAFDRVMRTNTIRCGYVLYEPFVRKDPNSGQFSGVTVDLMDEIGKLLNLKIEWTEEVGWATTVEGLRNNRYDAMCIGFWRQSLESKHVFYTQPFSYSMVSVVARKDDHRFDQDLSRINRPDIRIAGADGDVANAIAQRDFPQAKIQQAPNMADYSQLYEDVATNKADVTFVENATTDAYLKQHADRLRRLDVPPIRVFQNTLGFSQDERLKSMLDTVVIELVENGQMDKILDKYDPEQRLLMRIKRPGHP